MKTDWVEGETRKMRELEDRIKLLEKENKRLKKGKEKLQLKLNKAQWDLLTADP